MIASTFQAGSLDKADREEDTKKDPRIKKYIQLSQVLEQQILSGAVNFSTSEPELGRELLFQPSNDVTLELSLASSMTKELTPLVLYLRYIAKPGELLVIDEPEMNLHPEAQAKIIELLAILVNSGVNVLFTTHSPYIVDHLASLMKAAENEDQEAIRKEFYLQRTDAFIPKEKVSVYLVDEGKTTSGIDENGTIQLSTFGDVSNRISDIYFSL